MHYYSTRNKNLHVTLREAVFKGLASDGGLFMPERIPLLPAAFFQKLKGLSFEELSFEISKAFFQEDIDDRELKNLVYDAINFPTPLVRIEDRISTLELFHGPTLAFKDVGARFMARMLSLLVKNHKDDIHVLVATSGDTGSAVANGFLGVKGIKVHVLYPKGKVSKIQEIQFTTLGENISALEVDGTFDDCQRMVKQAFNSSELKGYLTLTSANSINLARLLPQSFYYFNAWRQISGTGEVVFCVPSGNFGNLTAGIIAGQMGLPVKHFITATNINDIVPQYLRTGKFQTRPSITTLANAMDVGAPSNFDRMLDLYQSHDKMKKAISGFSYTDEQIKEGIRECLSETGYLLDPHGSTGFMAAKEYIRQNNDDSEVIFLETAHPAKFRETVKESTGIDVEIPQRLQKFFNRKKHSIYMKNDFKSLRDYLLQFKLHV